MLNREERDRRYAERKRQEAIYLAECRAVVTDEMVERGARMLEALFCDREDEVFGYEDPRQAVVYLYYAMWLASRKVASTNPPAADDGPRIDEPAR